MIGYYVPHRVHPAGYHCDPRQPLPFAALASQKNYMSLYLMCVYADSAHSEWFRQAWARTGKKLDMGKACVRFKKVDDLALDVIGEAIRRMPTASYLKVCAAVVESASKRETGSTKKPNSDSKSRMPKKSRPKAPKSSPKEK